VTIFPNIFRGYDIKGPHIGIIVLGGNSDNKNGLYIGRSTRHDYDTLSKNIGTKRSANNNTSTFSAIF